jgi:hypothetical protein
MVFPSFGDMLEVCPFLLFSLKYLLGFGDSKVSSFSSHLVAVVLDRLTIAVL